MSIIKHANHIPHDMSNPFTSECQNTEITDNCLHLSPIPILQKKKTGFSAKLNTVFTDSQQTTDILSHCQET